MIIRSCICYGLACAFHALIRGVKEEEEEVGVGIKKSERERVVQYGVAEAHCVCVCTREGGLLAVACIYISFRLLYTVPTRNLLGKS